MKTPTKEAVREQLMSMLRRVCISGENKNPRNKAKAENIRHELRKLDDSFSYLLKYKGPMGPTEKVFLSKGKAYEALSECVFKASLYRLGQGEELFISFN